MTIEVMYKILSQRISILPIDHYFTTIDGTCTSCRRTCGESMDLRYIYWFLGRLVTTPSYMGKHDVCRGTGSLLAVPKPYTTTISHSSAPVLMSTCILLRQMDFRCQEWRKVGINHTHHHSRSQTKIFGSNYQSEFTRIRSFTLLRGPFLRSTSVGPVGGF
jgi:hypothetical protein